MTQPNFNLELQRFRTTSDTERENILNERNTKNTKRATKSSMAIFMDYLKEKNYPDLHDIPDSELPDIMLKFYTDLKKVDGQNYCVQSMKCICVGIK